jgi:hypothetical protein
MFTPAPRLMPPTVETATSAVPPKCPVPLPTPVSASDPEHVSESVAEDEVIPHDVGPTMPEPGSWSPVPPETSRTVPFANVVVKAIGDALARQVIANKKTKADKRVASLLRT